jgi:hypothetical protein
MDALIIHLIVEIPGCQQLNQDFSIPFYLRRFRAQILLVLNWTSAAATGLFFMGAATGLIVVLLNAHYSRGQWKKRLKELRGLQEASRRTGDVGADTIVLRAVKGVDYEVWQRSYLKDVSRGPDASADCRLRQHRDGFEGMVRDRADTLPPVLDCARSAGMRSKQRISRETECPSCLTVRDRVMGMNLKQAKDRRNWNHWAVPALCGNRRALP